MNDKKYYSELTTRLYAQCIENANDIIIRLDEGDKYGAYIYAANLARDLDYILKNECDSDEPIEEDFS